MPGSSYGGLTWNGQQAEPYNSTAGQATALAVAVGLGGAGMYAATRPMSDGRRPIDYAAAQARYYGNLSPFQILNTFRLPEMASPFTSVGYKTSAGPEGVTSWGKELLKNDSTYQWLRYATGQSDQQLSAAGINRGMKGPTSADSMVWEQRGTSSSGSLYSVKGETRTLLSGDISLMAMSQETINPLTKKKGLNRIAAGIFGAADMYSQRTPSGKEFSESRVLNGQVYDDVSGNWVKKQASFMPVPSLTGPVENLGDLNRRTVMARGVASFEMDRFNRLVSGVTEQFLGEKGSKAAQSILGVTPGIRPGPASAMFARFGGRAAMAGGALLAVSQTDWVRRNYGIPGQAFSSAVVGAAVAYGASKFNKNPRTAAIAGLAAFGVQMVFPGFDQGVWQGLATGAVSADIMRANALNPFNYLRRTLEGFAPGVTNWETGALVGIGAVAATTVRLPRAGKSWAQRTLKASGPDRLGLLLNPQKVDAVGRANSSVRDLYYEGVSKLDPGINAPHTTFMQRRRMLESLKTGKYKGKRLDMVRDLNSTFAAAEHQQSTFAKANPMNEALERRMQQIRSKYSGTGIENSLQRQGRGFAAQAYYSFFGANLGADKALRSRIQDMGFGSFKGLPTPVGRLGKLATVGLAAFGAHQLLLGGLLGSKDTAGDLREIYSGRRKIAVKKSRFWEAGGTPFSGGDTSYYRQHAYSLMMNRVRERGIWGDNEDDISPLGKFFKKNFTYDLERQQYWDRPYPMTSAAFSDIPIIGGIMSATVGQLIKPARIMHAGEWIRGDGSGGLEYASVFKGDRREPAISMGAHHGVPQNPYGAGAAASFASYQFRELEGMTGWAKNVVQQSITGEDVWGADNPMLADASLMTSSRLRFWETQMGGGLFTNEFLRRILPRYRSEIDRVNPVSNAMPSWLPDKFKWGDPYRLVEWGEARLPGQGYSALHPELKGVDAEAYPMLFKYAILSDVAPMTAEYNLAKQAVYQRRQEGQYNQKQIAFMDQVDAQHLNQVSGFVDDRMHDRAIRLPGSSLTQAGWAAGQRTIRKVAAPAEYLIPMGFRPVQKLMSDRGMIEQYEYERLYGTQMAFWDKPVRDWFRPSMTSALNMMGWEGKPLWRQQADASNEYFDKLEFVKWMQLKDQAEAMGDSKAVASYRWKAANTRMGVNPQGSSLGMYWTLPTNERKFFNAFAQASGKDRHRILEMVPADQQHLYQAMWSRMDSGDSNMWAGAGAVVNDAHLQNQLMKTQGFMSGKATPGEDWIGWHADVDMGDIQVRYVDRLGGELHDYGLWESQLKKSMQQPALEGSADFMFGPHQMLAPGLNYMTGVPGARGSWNAAPNGGTMSGVQINYSDSRREDIAVMAERYMSGY